MGTPDLMSSQPTPAPTHDQIEPTVPTRRFWLLTLLAFPVAAIAPAMAAIAIRAPFGLAALGLLALEAWVLKREPTIRRMAPRRRTAWIVFGCVTTAAIVGLGAIVLFFVMLFEHCSGGC